MGLKASIDVVTGTIDSTSAAAPPTTPVPAPAAVAAVATSGYHYCLINTTCISTVVVVITNHHSAALPALPGSQSWKIAGSGSTLKPCRPGFRSKVASLGFGGAMLAHAMAIWAISEFGPYLEKLLEVRTLNCGACRWGMSGQVLGLRLLTKEVS